MDLSANQILKALENPEIATAVENLKKHRENKVYIEATKMFLKTQEDQIAKGAAKYPEPLNPASWTVDQLAQHAFDELVDQSHYIKALQFKGNELERQLEIYRRAADRWGNVANELDKDCAELEKDRDRWKNDCEAYASKLDEVNDRLYQAGKDMVNLDSVCKQRGD